MSRARAAFDGRVTEVGGIEGRSVAPSAFSSTALRNYSEDDESALSRGVTIGESGGH